MKLIDEIKTIESSPKKLMEFGLTIGIVLALFVGVSWWKHREINEWWAVTAGIFILLAFLRSKLLYYPQKAWMTLALLMGWGMSKIILSIIYFVMMTPISIYLKFSGKDLLDRKIEKNVSSYWKLHASESNDSSQSYENQF